MNPNNTQQGKVLQWISDRQPPMSGVSYYCICLNLLTNKEEKRTIYSTKTGWEYPDSFKVLSWLEEKEITPIESAEEINFDNQLSIEVVARFPMQQGRNGRISTLRKQDFIDGALWASQFKTQPVTEAKESVLTDEKVNQLLAELKEVELSLPDTEGINKTLLKSIGYSFKLLFQIQKFSTPTVMSIRLKEREIAEKACAYAIENCIINLNTKDGIAVEIEFDSTQYLDTNYPIIK